jgi:hypothetical protein
VARERGWVEIEVELLSVTALAVASACPLSAPSPTATHAASRRGKRRRRRGTGGVQGPRPMGGPGPGRALARPPRDGPSAHRGCALFLVPGRFRVPPCAIRRAVGVVMRRLGGPPAGPCPSLQPGGMSGNRKKRWTNFFLHEHSLTRGRLPRKPKSQSV